MSRRTAVNLAAFVAATLVGLLTLRETYKLREPQIFLDYAALVLSGLTTAIITFFVVWGHFQKEPTPLRDPNAS